MKSHEIFEAMLPGHTHEDVVMGGVRQVMGLAMVLSIIAMAVVMLGLLLP